jgi:hypothetical protein
VSSFISLLILPCVLWYTGEAKPPYCCLCVAWLWPCCHLSDFAPSTATVCRLVICSGWLSLFFLTYLILIMLPPLVLVACLVVLLVVVSSMIVLGWVSLILVYALLFDLSVAWFCLPGLYQCLRACLIQTPFILLVCVCLCAGLLCRVDYYNLVIV